MSKAVSYIETSYICSLEYNGTFVSDFLSSQVLTPQNRTKIQMS